MSGQVLSGLVGPRAEEVMPIERLTDHPGQGCPAGLTGGSFSSRPLCTGLRRKGRDAVYLGKVREEDLGDDHFTRRAFGGPAEGIVGISLNSHIADHSLSPRPSGFKITLGVCACLPEIPGGE